MQSVLVIEDDHDTRVTVRQVLESTGYFVFSAANGVDGLALLLRIKPPSLILLDMLMPMMNGEEFLKAKNKDENLAAIPVVVMSAFHDRLRLVEAVETMHKPLNLKKLLETVRQHCGEMRSVK